MSLQPMEIFDRVYGGEVMWDGRYERYGTWNKSRLSQMKRVRGIGAIQLVASSGEGVKTLGEYGPQALPFPDMWVEFNHEDGYCHPECSGHALALSETEQGYKVTISRIVNGRIEVVNHHPNVCLNEAGCFNAVQYATPSGSNPDDIDAAVSRVPLFDAVMNIGLMNCKNVNVERIPRPARQPRKSRRKRTAKLDFHTIVLPGGGGTGGSGGSGGAEKARHMVRGHFATYTEENPLFGKYTGTYWKPWHVRGKAANGITVTDYKVEVPA